MASNNNHLLIIIRHLNTPEDVALAQEVNTWRSASADNERYYNEIYQIWEASPDAHYLELIDVETSVEKFSSKINSVDERESEAIPLRSGTSLWKWTAGVAALLAIALFSYLSYNRLTTVNYITKTTANFKDSVLLADGSTVFLDTNSTFRYPESFKGNSRPVSFISGNAFFKIAKDHTKPFIIQMGKLSVKVVGTSFNINKTTGFMQIDVKTGRVIFMVNDQQRLSLTAGQAAKYDLKADRYTSFSSANQNSDSWLTGELTFSDEPLAEVFKKLESHYHVQIALDSNLSHLGKLNAQFKNSSLNEVVTLLEQTYPLKIKRSGNTLIIRKKK